MNKVKLNEIIDYLQPAPYLVSSENYDNSYKTPVLTAGKTFILGKTDDVNGIYKASNNPIILFDDFTTDIKWVNFDFKVKSSACKILIPKELVNIKYVYYAMKSIKFNVFSHKRHWITEYSKIKIYYPDTLKQNYIVTILDKINNVIKLKLEQIKNLDLLIKSRFVEEVVL